MTPGRIPMILMILCLTAGAVAQDEPALERGRELTQRFYEQKLDDLWLRFEQPLKDDFVNRQGLERFRQQVAGLGEEGAVLSETVTRAGASMVYSRTASFKQAPLAFLVQWSFKPDGGVTGLLVTAAEAAPSKYLGYQTKTGLRLPFQGEWSVVWGGRELSENYHAMAEDQRFAYDFVIMRGGSSKAGMGERNEDYYCFGKPILAPGSGVVHAVEKAVADNVPGVMNSTQTMGNYVILDHGNGEFSFLAHLRQGSVMVNQGERVWRGDLLGDCGNSGNSSEPHLHYHLQDTGDVLAGKGLPAQFSDYSADGQPVARGEPVRGQVIRPQEGAKDGHDAATPQGAR